VADKKTLKFVKNISKLLLPLQANKYFKLQINLTKASRKTQKRMLERERSHKMGKPLIYASRSHFEITQALSLQENGTLSSVKLTSVGLSKN
jgi:hypothetical protein